MSPRNSIISLVGSLLIAGCGQSTEPSTFCPEEGPTSTTVMILDESDPLEEHQLSALSRFTDSLIETVRTPSGESQPSENYIGKGGLLVIYRLATPSSKPKAAFRMCNPGSPNDRKPTDVFTEGDITALMKWSKFKERLDAALPKERSGNTLAKSPIIETIRFVRNEEFPRGVDIGKGRKGEPGYTLILVSDLLQNSARVSHYDGLPAVEGLPQSMAISLSGIDIAVRYLRSSRDGHLQSGEHFAWWRRFFVEAGAPMSRAPESW